MKIYTRTGDAGQTALFGGGRVSKDHPRVRACGTVDELNACLGRSLPSLGDPGLEDRLSRVQHDLFTLGAHLASPPSDGGGSHHRLPPLPEARPAEMEAWIDEAEEGLEPLTEFILPGGSPGARELHVCRTVCRRAERAVVHLERSESREEGRGGASAVAFAIRYLNRLSDLLFVLARLENRRAGIPDVTWERPS